MTTFEKKCLPKPKFKLGQIVYCEYEDCYTVIEEQVWWSNVPWDKNDKVELEDKYNQTWYYITSEGGTSTWNHQDDFRKLNKKEIGL